MKQEEVKHGANNYWDPVHIEYPVFLAPGTGESSTTIGHEIRSNPQVLSEQKRDTAIRGISENVVESHRNALVTKDLSKSQTTVDFGYKPPTVWEKFHQATPAGNNLYLHGGNRRLERYAFNPTAHGVSEMRSSYPPPTTSAELSIDMAQYKHPYNVEMPELSPSPIHDASPIDISTDCFIKHLDPYVSTTHLQHTPFTKEHLERCSNTRDVVTYYTFADVPKVRPGPTYNTGEWWYPKPVGFRKSMSDKAKFKFEFREIRAHNQVGWTPTSLITETAKNFITPSSHPESKVRSEEELVKEYFNREAARFRPADEEKEVITKGYATEYGDMNSGRPITARLNQEAPKKIVFKHMSTK